MSHVIGGATWSYMITLSTSAKRKKPFIAYWKFPTQFWKLITILIIFSYISFLLISLQNPYSILRAITDSKRTRLRKCHIRQLCGKIVFFFSIPNMQNNRFGIRMIFLIFVEIKQPTIGYLNEKNIKNWFWF